MNRIQKKSLFFIYLRDDNPLPRGSLRLYPELERYGAEGVKPNGSVQDIMQFCYFNKDIFVNLFSDYQKEHHIYDMIFLDIDHKELDTSLSNLIKIVMKLKSAGVEHYNIYFSGSKGFHIYIQFEPTFLNNYRTSIVGWLKFIDVFRYIDPSCIEPNRVTRVPHSINSKSGMRCIPITTNLLDLDMGVICEQAKQDVLISDQALIVNKGLGVKINKYDSLNYYSDSATIGKESQIFADIEMYPDCMRELVDGAMNGKQLNHFERLEMGKFLLYVTGGNVDLVMKYYKQQDNYQESKTKFHLNYILKRNLKMCKCDGMADYGICPYKRSEQESKCPYAPSVNHFITNELESIAK